MLAEITIRNFAIIDHLTVDFGTGMTVLSGQTGAGKSILVDALNLILGNRADGASVRHDAKRADISARFSLADAPDARNWLADHELDGEDECVMRRVIAREGGSRGWINGTPMPARELRSLGEHLVNIHGQHMQQALLQHAIQRRLLDEFGDYEPELMAVAEAAHQLRQTQAEIKRIEQRDAQGHSRLELLRYQVEELNALDLEPGDSEALGHEHRRLASAERLIADGQQALALLIEREEGAATDQLGTAQKLLDDLTAIDSGFSSISELIGSALVHAQEAADELRRHIDTLDIDPARFAVVEERLGTLQDIARKHQIAPDELYPLTQRLNAELAALEGEDERLAQLKSEEQTRIAAYDKGAEQLSQARSKAAPPLAKEINAIIRSLGMPEACFTIDVAATPDHRFSPDGCDQISFLIAANPGQGARPLEKVASGGELSRISLAIEVVAAARMRVPTLVFDEVDTGIGGGVAEIVGQQLRALGQTGQALCVTHLPQVAAQAGHHLYVSKTVSAGQTRTHIQTLEKTDRIEELARMLGGVELTEQTRAHAADMMARAERREEGAP